MWQAATIWSGWRASPGCRVSRKQPGAASSLKHKWHMVGGRSCESCAAGGALGPPLLVRRDAWGGTVWSCAQSGGGRSSESVEDADTHACKKSPMPARCTLPVKPREPVGSGLEPNGGRGWLRSVDDRLWRADIVAVASERARRGRKKEAVLVNKSHRSHRFIFTYIGKPHRYPTTVPTLYR